VTADLYVLLGGVEGFEGDSVERTRTPPALPALVELKRLTRSCSIFSIEGVGEFL
jgi:hypothetical protein